MDGFVTPELDALFHQPVRTRLTAFLSVHGEATFSELKQLLDITDGNLDAHLKKLIAARFIKVRKAAGPKRPQTFYSLTAAGRHAFEQYVDALQRVLACSSKN